MKQSLCNIQSSLPEDIALKIASLLEEPEVCALGCCSRFWRNLCGSDCIWEFLTRQRWPLLLSGSSESSAQNSGPTSEGWKGFYMKRHNEMAHGATDVVKYVEQCMRSYSVEVGDYLQAIEDLNLMQLGFKDVQMFLFKPKLNVLLNLVGLHYCIFWLNVPPEYVLEALHSCKISDRQLCVKWWKLGRWFYGFRMRDESHSRLVSLADLATAKEEEVLGVLHRGAIHEVLRVQISFVNSSHTPWSCQSTQGQD
ncbi:F-box-like domain-containing protein [Melia azedarach]|uniref:F-box-like domain-containing protein n=1 Tax=Melia azedarach TaxID=155640 RepID=A0ACC1YEH9_MELAZ|nr:F-box-like domain-containing protein [Melia azedarach]